MLRSFGVSLLMLGLLAVGVDGFRQRERARGANTTQAGMAHTAENSAIPPQ